MILKPDKLRRVIAIVDASTNLFVELTRIAELDPARDFRGADLRGVDLSSEDLSGFNFTGADLTDADLRGTDLSRVRGLHSAVLDRVNTDSRTLWPFEKAASTKKRVKQPARTSRFKIAATQPAIRSGDLEVLLLHCDLVYKPQPSIKGTIRYRHLSSVTRRATRRVSLKFDVYDATGKIALSTDTEIMFPPARSPPSGDVFSDFSVTLPQRALDVGVEARAVLTVYNKSVAIST